MQSQETWNYIESEIISDSICEFAVMGLYGRDFDAAFLPALHVSKYKPVHCFPFVVDLWIAAVVCIHVKTIPG